LDVLNYLSCINYINGFMTLQAFYGAGGGDSESFFEAFSWDLVEAALNVLSPNYKLPFLLINY
jgi:hypothetical protein